MQRMSNVAVYGKVQNKNEYQVRECWLRELFGFQRWKVEVRAATTSEHPSICRSVGWSSVSFRGEQQADCSPHAKLGYNLHRTSYALIASPLRSISGIITGIARASTGCLLHTCIALPLEAARAIANRSHIRFENFERANNLSRLLTSTMSIHICYSTTVKILREFAYAHRFRIQILKGASKWCRLTA